MTKYMMVYTADEAFDMSAMPEEEIKKEMEEWGEWLGTIGPKVKDEGDAFKFGGKVISKEEEGDSDTLITGYTIIEADNYDEALSYARTCPVISQGGKVHVYECFGL